MDGKVKVTGPEYYFPSIGRKYGKTIAEWQALMLDSGLTTHGKLVAWLKAEHGFGHGHATAITGHLLARGRPAPDRD